MVVIIFLISFIYGKLLGEYVRFKKSSEKFYEIQTQYNELTEEYNKIHNEIESELNNSV